MCLCMFLRVGLVVDVSCEVMAVEEEWKCRLVVSGACSINVSITLGSNYPCFGVLSSVRGDS